MYKYVYIYLYVCIITKVDYQGKKKKGGAKWKSTAKVKNGVDPFAEEKKKEE